MKVFRKMILVAATAIPVAAFAQDQSDILNQRPTQATVEAYLRLIQGSSQADQAQQVQLQMLRQQLEQQRQQTQMQQQQIQQMQMQEQAANSTSQWHPRVQQTTTQCRPYGDGMICNSQPQY